MAVVFCLLNFADIPLHTLSGLSLLSDVPCCPPSIHSPRVSSYHFASLASLTSPPALLPTHPTPSFPCLLTPIALTALATFNALTAITLFTLLFLIACLNPPHSICPLSPPLPSPRSPALFAQTSFPSTIRIRLCPTHTTRLFRIFPT